MTPLSAQLKALIEAVRAYVPAIPPKDAACHVGFCEQERCGNCSRIIAIHEALDALTEAEKRDGWVLVPREPTEAMLERGFDAINQGTAYSRDEGYIFDDTITADTYRAMIAATPATADET